VLLSRIHLKIALTASICIGVFNTAISQNCTVNANVDQSICANQPIVLNGSASGLIQSGTILWTQVSGPAVIITSPTALSTNVTGFTGGNTYIFRLNAKCNDGSNVFDQVSYTVRSITISNTGAAKLLCPGTPGGTMTANFPGVGETGLWSGSGAGITLASTTNPITAINTSATSAGTAPFTWTITNINGCSSSSTVSITNRGGVVPVSAGPDILASAVTCYSTTATVTMNASFGGNGAAGQIGTWSFISGPSVPTFSNPFIRNTNVSNLIQGTYVLRWIVSGACANGSDNVSIFVPASTNSLTSLGSNNTLSYCDNRTTAILTVPSPSFVGESGRWTQLSGPTTAIITDTTASNTTVTGLNGLPGSTYTFRYTLTNLFGCSTSVTRTIRFFSPVDSMVILGGNQILACNQSSTSVSYIASGGNLTQYRIISGPPGPFTYPTGFTTSNTSPQVISGLTAPGTYIVQFQRTVNLSTNACPPNSTTLSITTSFTPTASNAGSNQILVCSDTTTALAGNNPLVGTGTWYQFSGPNTANIVNPNSSTSNINGLINGVYLFKWSISAGPTCSVNEGTARVVVATVPPTTSVAGSNSSVCFNSPFGLSANTPASNETGTWTVSPSAGVVFSNINSPTSTVVLPNPLTSYNLTWTITNACGSSASSLVLTTLSTSGPVTANAGVDQCFPSSTTSFTLAGNDPVPGTGTWRKLTGPACIITDTTLFNSTVTGMSNGVYTFEWATSRNVCAITRDTIEITISAPVTTAAAGPNQDICGTSTFVAANTPSVGTGIWSQVSGPTGFSIANVNSPTSGVTGLAQGTYVLRWTISIGSCSSSQSDMTIQVSTPQTIANAGANQFLCGTTSTTLAANTPASGSGFWTIVSGPGIPTFSSVNSPTATISGLTQGTYVLRWNIPAGSFCPASSSTVSITVVPIASAGTTANLCEAGFVELTGNTGSTGTWSQFSGPAVTITSTGPNTAAASGLTGPNSYVFTYTIPTIGTCASTSSNRTIIVSAQGTTANAGSDQNVCRNPSPVTVTFAGNTATTGKGVWSKLAGPSGGDVFSPNDSTPSATVSISNSGTYVYSWRISNGACSNADQVTINVFTPPTTSNAGPPITTVCDTVATMAASATSVGSGLWTQDSGPNTAGILAPNSSNSIMTGLVPGTYVFRWTTSNGTCPTSTSTVNTTVFARPTAANAGPDQNLCNVTSATLAGNPILSGSGLWSQLSGPNSATISDATLNNTLISGLITGMYTFRWTSTLTPCSSSDTVQINISQLPTVANAGNDSAICISSNANLYANAALVGTGIWTQVSGPSLVTFINSNSPTTQIIGQIPGVYIFEWTISNGSCTASSDQVSITFSSVASLAVAGINQTGLSTCGLTSLTLSATNPSAGTGLWSVTSGSGGSFGNPNINSTTFSGVAGNSYILRWTVSNGACSNFDEINITFNQNPGPPSATPIVCINNSIPSIKHKTFGATGIGTPSALPAGVSVSFSSDTITITGIPTTSGTYSYSVPTIGSICSAPASGIITVTPDKTASAASTTPTICINNAITTITHTTSGATGIGVATGLPTGVSAIFSSDTIRISGTPTVSGTFNYSIPLTGGCGTVSASGTITITPDNTTSAASTTPTICINNAITTITHITTGATTYSSLGSAIPAMVNK